MSASGWVTLPAAVGQVCAELVDGELPFPVRLPSYGRTTTERAELVADAHRFLAEAGLGGGTGLSPELDRLVDDLCRHTWGMTLLAWSRAPDGEPEELRAVAAEHEGRWTVAVLQAERLHLASWTPGPGVEPLGALLDLVPPAVPAALPVVVVPGGEALAEAGLALDADGPAAAVEVLVRRGGTAGSARVVLEVHATTVLTAQISAQRTLSGRSRRSVCTRPVTLQQGPLGRYALVVGDDGWITQVPDGPDLLADLAHHLEDTVQVDPLVEVG